MSIPTILASHLKYSILLLSLLLLSCATQPTIDVTKKKAVSEIIGLIEKTVHVGDNADEAQIRKKMQAFKRALSKRVLSEADWSLHDELLDEYIRIKKLSETKVVISPKTKLVIPLESYCLDPNKASPSEKEIYHWQRAQPQIPYYKDILGLRRVNSITQGDTQTLIWNLRNNTKWEDYPNNLKAILKNIDPQAPLKLPSNLKNQAKDSIMGLASGITGVETAKDLYRTAEGKFYQFKDFAKQIDDLSSQFPLSNHDDLTKIPGTELYSQSSSNGYSGQTLNLYNPADETQEIDLEDYYLISERNDVQSIGLNPRQNRGLLSDLENLLFGSMLRLGVGFSPVVNDVANLYELFTGKDFISGETLSPLERSLSGLGLIAGSGAGYRYAQRAIYAPEKYSARFVEGIEKVAQKPLSKIETRVAEESLQNIRKRPHQSRAAEEINRSHIATGNLPPYKAKTRVVEFESLEGEKWVRVHGQHNQTGSWVVREEAVKNLSPQQLQKKYSLPKAPSEVSDVTLPKGVKVRRGRVAENFGGNSSAVQYEILDKELSEVWFANRRSLP